MPVELQVLEESHRSTRRLRTQLAVTLALLASQSVAFSADAPNRIPTDSANSAELRRASERAALCSASNVKGTGLRGEYFESEVGRGTPLLVRVDSSVDFEGGLDWPAGLVAKRPRAVRWTGWIRPPITGRYRFHLDGATSSVTVAHQAVTGPEVGDAGIELAAGRYYPVVLEIKHLDVVKGKLQFEWTAPFGARYVVPRTLLFIPS